MNYTANHSIENKVIKEEDAEKFPQYESAIERNFASFSQLVTVTYGWNAAFEEDEIMRRNYRQYCPKILRAFEAAYGGIVDIYFCSKQKAAVVLTDRHHFFAEYTLQGQPQIEHLLIECERVSSEAHRLLVGKDLKSCAEKLYYAAKRLMCLADCERDEKEASEIAALVKQQLNEAKKHQERASRMKAQGFYFEGLLIGLFIGVGLLFIISILSQKFTNLLIPHSDQFYISLVSGGIGALVSVMSRMSFGTLDIEHEVGTNVVRRLGIMRPLLGAFFGVIVFALLHSGLIFSVLVPQQDEAIFFFSITGFLAGFSERWAPDMLAVTEKRIIPKTGGSGS